MPRTVLIDFDRLRELNAAISTANSKNLTSPCPAVDSFTSPSWDELMKSYLKLVIQYSESASKHQALRQGKLGVSALRNQYYF